VNKIHRELDRVHDEIHIHLGEPMVKRMSAAEYAAWRDMYKRRLDSLRTLVIRTLKNAKEGYISEEESEKIVLSINEEGEEIIECIKILNNLKDKGN